MSLYNCEICGLPANEHEDLADIPTPSILDPEAFTRMCRECAQGTIVDFEDYFEEYVDTEEFDGGLDPLYLEEMGLTDELD